MPMPMPMRKRMQIQLADRDRRASPVDRIAIGVRLRIDLGELQDDFTDNRVCLIRIWRSVLIEHLKETIPKNAELR